jgi:hypothetical protein
VLEYLDDNGRQLAPSEAFRRQCYAFHGIAPGAKTRERRDKRDKRNEVSIRGGEALSATGHTKAREQAGKAFIVLEGRRT